MLVAVADLAILAAAAGAVATLFVLATLVSLAGLVVAFRTSFRPSAEPAKAVARRRA